MLNRLRGLFARRARGTVIETTAPPEGVAARSGSPALAKTGSEEHLLRPPIHRGPTVVHIPIPAQELDPDAVRIIQRLTRFDHTAYLVGGCVRDLLLDRRPKDFDIATSATPRQVKRSFSNCRIIGRRFRLAHVYFHGKKIIEVATFRARDGDNGDGAIAPDDDLLIREDNVFGTPEQDALRRDFTINALFYDVNAGNVLDHADGLGDLRRHVVRTLGDPEIRFREDPIRILRAIKFAARLGFQIEETTLAAILRTRHEIPKAAPPRILEEINRFCRGGAGRRSFELARETGVLDVILPELAGGYATEPATWNLAASLLSALDRRQSQGHEASMGEIFATLLLPLLARRLGWREDGTLSRERGVHARELGETMLRPIALRLRVARRDQERCRQALSTIQRMVPAGNLRRSARHSIQRRPGFPDALWMLEACAERFGGQFADAFEVWKVRDHGAGSVPSGPAQPASLSTPDAVVVSSREASPGRRGRQSGERKATGVTVPTPVARERQPSRPGLAQGAKGVHLPPVWDDNYFFAALPTAPSIEVEEGRPAPAGEDREPTPSAAAEDGNAATPVAIVGESASGPDTSRHDRRRRGRRRRRGGGDRSPSKVS